MRRATYLVLSSAVALAASSTSFAAPINWANAAGNTDWGTGTSWTGGTEPTNVDVGVFGNVVSIAAQPNVAATGTRNVLGVTIDNAGADWQINGSGLLTIGASGIVVAGGGTSSVAPALTLNGPMVIGNATSNNAYTLNLNGPLTATSALTFQSGTTGSAQAIVALGSNNSGTLSSNLRIHNRARVDALAVGSLGTGAVNFVGLSGGAGSVLRISASQTINNAITFDAASAGTVEGNANSVVLASPLTILVNNGNSNVHVGHAAAQGITTVTGGITATNGTTSIATNLGAISTGSGGVVRLESNIVTGATTPGPVRITAGSSGSVRTTATVSLDSLSRLHSGNLRIGANVSGDNFAGQAVLVLDGRSTGADNITWSDLTAARSFGTGLNQFTFGSNGTDLAGGGFAARGADVTIGGLPANTFDRSFMLGSRARDGSGNRYANFGITVSDGFALSATNNRVITVHGSNVDSPTIWTPGDTVHDLTGVVSGGATARTLFIRGYDGAVGQGFGGILRFSNPNNSFTGNIVINPSRGAAPEGDGITTDFSAAAAIFTSDAAFGNAANVVYVSHGSNSAGGGMLLFQDTNAGGNTTFAKSFNVLGNSSAGFGSYGGDVVYSGNGSTSGIINFYQLGTGSSTAGPTLPIHVRAGTMTLGSTGNPATLNNNRIHTSTFGMQLNKSGAGTLIQDNLSFGGTNADGRSWRVYQGTLLHNQAGVAYRDFDVFAGATLGGTGQFSTAGTLGMAGILSPGTSPGTLDITGNLAFSTGSSYVVELGGLTPGDGAGFYDQVNLTGNIDLAGTVGLTVSLEPGFGPATSDVFYILTRSGAGTLTGTGSSIFAGLPEGATVSINGIFTGQITYKANWLGTQAGSSLSGGNDVAIFNVIVPEPTSLAAVACGALVALRRRRA
jgi:fibronectin-binding autotransporter adhesin